MTMDETAGAGVPGGGGRVAAARAYHEVVMNPEDRRRVAEGRRVTVKLHVEEAGEVRGEVAVQKQAPAGQPEAHKH